RAVSTDRLRRRHNAYRITQLAIFTDARCTLPANITTADLTPDALIGLGPSPRQPTIVLDKFVAAEAGKKTYAIPGKTPSEDRCIFTGVLTVGLWGQAISRHRDGFVVSGSLSDYIRREVPKIA